MIKILPCPFCGNDAIDVDTVGTEDREGWPTVLCCQNCGAMGPWSYVHDKEIATKELIDLWNTRVNENKITT